MTSQIQKGRVDALRSAPPNYWVALSEDENEVVASGATYEDVVRATEEMGIKDPVILKTPASWLPISV
ncbi:MAG TPA: DUF5678 domain-containing protein [Terriglobales bacterium]|jgi:TPP-dependent indolepyruvate ferredoxin oxidoreductase alpha subunit|nr:DUF5678 domain-containing protein [Terriglobales bacterium]